jgi:AcrR family transcriptional regulator
MVQHYFRTKDEMMAFAVSVVRDRGQARLEAAVAALGPEPAPRLLLRTLLVALLPLDEAAREDGRVALAFLSWTTRHPVAAPTLRADTEQLVRFIAGLLPVAPAAALAAAAGMLALVEGLGVYLLGGQYTPAQALAALDNQLSLLFA